MDLKHLDPATIKRGVASKAGGASALANYRHALRMVADGQASAVCFTPFNKRRCASPHPRYDDEIGFTSDVLGIRGRRDRIQHPRRPLERARHVARSAGGRGRSLTVGKRSSRRSS